MAADFLALGYAHFVVETITVGIRYSTTLDESAFERELLAAAVAACGGAGDEARARLQAAFDLLHTARDSYSPSESHLLDLTLVASTTLGAALRAQLAGRGPTGDVACNLLLSAEVLEQMADREPATLAALRQTIEQGTSSIVGGEFCELELPLLGPEAIRGQLEKGLSIYRKHLDTQPTVFGWRRFGMTPVLPQILDGLGFTGVVHSTLDDGRFPVGNSSRASWEGIDGTTVEALLRVPIDASRGPKVSSACRMPCRALPTWIISRQWSSPIGPAKRVSGTKTSIGHAAIRQFSAPFQTLPDYFERTGMSGHQTTPQADEYRSPYLQQAVAAGQIDPLSRWMRYFERRAAAEAAQSIAALATLVAGKPSVCVDDILGGD